MNDDFITQAVFDYLENGGELPPEASKNPQSRFMFQTAISRQTYAKSCEAQTVANKAQSDIETFREVMAEKFKGLLRVVDIRLGLVATIIIVLEVVFR